MPFLFLKKYPSFLAATYSNLNAASEMKALIFRFITLREAANRGTTVKAISCVAGQFCSNSLSNCYVLEVFVLNLSSI